MTLLGIPSARPVAFLEKRWGPLRSKAYLITEYTEGIDAYRWFRSKRVKEGDHETLVRRFGELLQMLANGSVSHGDFKTTNFIVTGNELILMDLDGMRQHRFRWRFRRAFRKDLKRLLRDWTELPEVEELFRQQLEKIEW
jgi:hypothetical protein